MKFADFLINEGNLSPSIDDNDVLTKLDDIGAGYNRTKLDNGSLNYEFDNRYSVRYDGTLFTLYRHGNRIHYLNARNKKEIDFAIDQWNNSYRLFDVELTDDDVDDIIAALDDKVDEPEEENTDDDLENNEKDQK